jgi:hypothetical protein
VEDIGGWVLERDRECERERLWCGFGTVIVWLTVIQHSLLHDVIRCRILSQSEIRTLGEVSFGTVGIITNDKKLL